MPTTTIAKPVFHDFAPTEDHFREDVLAGLGRERKTLSSKYFYDRRGSLLFDRICELPEYYPTRTEIAIMRAFDDEMAAALGERCCLIELGSGSSIKTNILLDHLDRPAACVLVDISREHLRNSAAMLARAYPDVEIIAICADFLAEFELPRLRTESARRVVYFPGSTIGNFEPDTARRLLRRIRRLVGDGGGLLIGADLKKDRAILEAAYNDSAGVTRAFNKNLLHRANRELGADFDVSAFEHVAFYNAGLGRIESHLVSQREQDVTIDGAVFHFETGESIHTENSHKYSLEDFRKLAHDNGFEVEQVWTDPKNLFSVQYLAAR